MANEEDKEFLINQRKKGRVGCMLGVDEKLCQIEKQKTDRLEVEAAKKRRCVDEIDKLSSMAELLQSTSSSSAGEAENSNSSSNSGEQDIILLSDSEFGPSTSTSATRGNVDIITPRLAATLDRCKVSDRDAIHLLMSTAEAIGCDTNQLIINRTSLRRCRTHLRTLRYIEVKKKFSLPKEHPVVVHWDGKLLPSLSGIEKVDRLVILLTYGGQEQLIAIPGICNSTGLEQANAVYKSLEEWGL